MEDVVHTSDGFIHGCLVANVAFDHPESAAAPGAFKVAVRAANEVVEHAHFGGSCVKQLIRSGAAHKTGTAGDQYLCTFNGVHLASLGECTWCLTPARLCWWHRG